MDQTKDRAREKREIRREMLARRREMTAEEAAARAKKVRERIRGTAEYRQAESICLYFPIQNEVDVRALGEGKAAYLPRVEEGHMEFYRYEGDDRLRRGAFGIPEPLSREKLTPDARTLIVMPGAAFSLRGDRIGYGGGYYDEYLSRHPGARTLAAAYDFQIVESLPREPHDFRPELIATESGVYEIAHDESN